MTQMQILRFGIVALSVSAFALPFCSDFARMMIDSAYQPIIVIVILLVLLSLKTVATVLGYVPVIIFVNDSCTELRYLGTVHGNLS
jgi:hypothetical protein